jgi:ubiquitin-protein ligase
MSSGDSDEVGVHLSSASVRRLLKDVKDLYTNKLEGDGIYYRHDEADCSRGYALIIGPAGTLYENGYFFYRFEFPPDYPHSPPRVTYCTNDGCVRFHPNFYRSGKVCLSLLNTWRGEGWTSCQSIRSVLLILCSLLSNDPLLNEPGVSRQHPDFDTYNKIVQYKTLSVAVAGMLDETVGIYPSPYFDRYRSEVVGHFLGSYERNMSRIRRLGGEQNPETLSTVMYHLNVDVDYGALERKMENVRERLVKGTRATPVVGVRNRKIEIKKPQ